MLSVGMCRKHGILGYRAHVMKRSLKQKDNFFAFKNPTIISKS
jgi:hypothetical protein